jgi:hypothetical protein
MYFLIIIKLITNNKIYKQSIEDEETNFSLPSLIDSESLLQEVIFLFKFFRLLLSLYVFIKIVTFINNRNLIIFRLDLWKTLKVRKRRLLPASHQLGVKKRAKVK